MQPSGPVNVDRLTGLLLTSGTVSNQGGLTATERTLLLPALMRLLGEKVNGIIVGDHFYYVMTATRIGGLVVDGRIRDLDGLSEIDMPAYFQHADATLIGNVMLTGMDVGIAMSCPVLIERWALLIYDTYEPENNSSGSADWF